MRQACAGGRLTIVLAGLATSLGACGSVASEEPDADVTRDGDSLEGRDGDTGHEAEAGPDADVVVDAEVTHEVEDVGWDGEEPEVCGNGRVEPGEICDDGNEREDDGCDGDCTYSCDADDQCTDGDQCTLDRCQVVSGGKRCVNELDVGKECDDGNPCTAGDSCQSDGSCGGGASGCPCGTSADCAPFDDDDLCNGIMQCIDNECAIDPTTVIRCLPSGDPCRTNSCVPATGNCLASLLPDGTSCDDFNACTSPDACQRGTCVGTPAVEICNHLDDDCDGGTDEELESCAVGGTSRHLCEGETGLVPPVGASCGAGQCQDCTCEVESATSWLVLRCDEACVPCGDGK